jgi:sporulation protein YlmC with PRC-barrel domain
MNNLTQDDLTGINQGALYSNVPLKYLTASSIIGDKVHNNQDEHLGKIVDIMIDIVAGKIDYYIVEFSGFLGVNVKYFAIPFEALTVDAEKKAYIFDQKRQIMEDAPGFDQEHWPDTNIHLEKITDGWSFMG